MEKHNFFDEALKGIELLTWAFLFITLALKLFGFYTFDFEFSNSYILRFIEFVDSTPLARVVINVLTGLLSANLLFGAVVKNYLKCAAILNLITVAFLLFLNLTPWGNFETLAKTLLAFSIYFLPLIFTKNIKSSFEILIIDNLFIFLSFFTKSMAVISANNSFLNYIALADYYLFLFLYLLLKRRNVKWHYFCKTALDFLKKSLTALKSLAVNMLKRLQKQPMLSNAEQSKTDLLPVTTVAQSFRQCLTAIKLWIKIDLPHRFVREWLPLLIVFSVYGAAAILTNKILEAIFLYIAYLHFRKLFPKHFHADYIPGIKRHLIPLTCVSLTSLMLCVALHNVVGGGVSVISSIIVALLIDCMLYVLRDWLDFKVRYNTDFTKYGLTKEMASFAYDWKVLGLKDKQLMEIHKIMSVNTLNSRKRRIKHAIRTK